MSFDTVGTKMVYSTTLIYHGRGKNVGACIYAPLEGENAGQFQATNTFGPTAWHPTKAAAIKELKAIDLAAEAAYKAKWGDVCLYPCSVCGRARCNH